MALTRKIKKQLEKAFCRVAAVVLILFYIFVWLQTVGMFLAVTDAERSHRYLWKDIVGGLAIPLTLGMVLIIVATVIIVKEICKKTRKVH